MRRVTAGARRRVPSFPFLHPAEPAGSKRPALRATLSAVLRRHRHNHTHTHVHTHPECPPSLLRAQGQHQHECGTQRSPERLSGEAKLRQAALPRPEGPSSTPRVLRESPDPGWGASQVALEAAVPFEAPGVTSR